MEKVFLVFVTCLVVGLGSGVQRDATCPLTGEQNSTRATTPSRYPPLPREIKGDSFPEVEATQIVNFFTHKLLEDPLFVYIDLTRYNEIRAYDQLHQFWSPYFLPYEEQCEFNRTLRRVREQNEKLKRLLHSLSLLGSKKKNQLVIKTPVREPRS